MSDLNRPAQLRDLAQLSFAALGVYVLVGTVFPLESMVLAATIDLGDADSERITFRFAAIDSATRAVFGFGLILARKALAARFASTQELPTLARQDLLAILLAVLGVSICIRGLAGSAQHFVSEPSGRTAIASVLLFVLGGGLFLGARGVARMWAQLRGAP
jgi:hypothetical protein